MKEDCNVITQVEGRKEGKAGAGRTDPRRQAEKTVRCPPRRPRWL